MNEVTEIITAQITVVKKNLDEESVKVIEESKAERKGLIADALKNFFDADNVTIEIKDFVIEKQ